MARTRLAASSPQARHRGWSGAGGVDGIVVDGLAGNKQVRYIQTTGKVATISGKGEGFIVMVA